MMIETSAALAEVCGRLSKASFITVDTEFIREKTYYPVLCLIQIASPVEAHCVDPLAEGIDLKPLFDLMQNKKVLKVFHAARQDIEIFYHLSGAIPAPLFDTQVGAMVCGFGESASYQQLVQELTGVSLDKSMRYTDWSKRPLSAKQVSYALCDVTYLVQVYEKLQASLEKSGRTDWLAEEMEVLNNPATYEVDDEAIWQRFKCPLAKAQLIHVFAKVCAWRERVAKLKDRPRRHILKDEVLVELAAAHPETEAELEALRAIPKGFAQSHLGMELLEVIKSAMADKPDTYVASSKRKPLTNAQKNLAELVRLLLDVVSSELGVASKVIADSDSIAAFVTNDKTCAFLKGWRLAAFGQKAMALKSGKICFRYDPKKYAVTLDAVA